MRTSIDIRSYLSEVQSVFSTGSATEHSYRSALQRLFSSIDNGVTALNEPRRVKCGAPDFLISRGPIVVGHVEAKDIDKKLESLKGADSEQKQRYLGALPNLIYTNCLDFQFFREGQLINTVSIADFKKNIFPKPAQYAALEHQLKEFAAQHPQTIDTSERLAEIMAAKAALIKDLLYNSLMEDIGSHTELTNQFFAFKEHLIHDIRPTEFADIYAETVAYGMFAARLNDKTVEDFSRQEALELIPKSNPFLRALFTYIAGPELDDRIRWVIDDLANVFQAADLQKIMENFGSMTGRRDPFLHFYETFLSKYNPDKRKSRGVWYTPEPVVNFIVRAVDDLLKAEFSLPMGLADTTRVTIDWDTGQPELTKKGKVAKSGRNAIEKKEVHRVQILDPAVGTGTFLAEVIKLLAPRVRTVAGGLWSRYIERDLIPRLHGFEILMASYAMSHMKLDMVLEQLGYVPTHLPPRLSVYLTNSLEKGEPANQSLPFAQWLSNEVRLANAVKRDMPIMCIIGNPPYNSSSKNTNDWILEELSPYKSGLGEKKVNLDDDYVKFLRMAEVFIERNGFGIVAMITNNSFLDGTSHRLMRRHLLATFNVLYILNLHGDIRNDSTEGNKDENVFDITQGVAITLMVRTQSNDGDLARLMYCDVVGRRQDKYDFLVRNSIASAAFSQIEPHAPRFRFLPTTDNVRGTYERGFGLNEFFNTFSSGIQTKRDKLCVALEKMTLERTIVDFELLDCEELRSRYQLPDDGRDWTIEKAKADVCKRDGHIVPFLYKPFDMRYLYYSGRTKGFVAYPRYTVMRHMVGKDNIALITNRQNVRNYFSFAMVTKVACNHGTFYLGNRGQDYCFPLYLYPKEDELTKDRRINFRENLFDELLNRVSSANHRKPTEVEVFDYIYAILHSVTYRKVYAKLLRADFPRIPWPENPDQFWSLSDVGTELRRLHLLESDTLRDPGFPFVGDGTGTVEFASYRAGSIWTNDAQRFEDVPEAAWNFEVGGYKPAQTWLKARKGRQLYFEEIIHYQKMIGAMLGTRTIMDRIKFDPNR